MSFWVPDIETDSTDGEQSFYSQGSYTMSAKARQSGPNDEDHDMIQEQRSTSETLQEQQNRPLQNPGASYLSAIPPDIYAALREQLTREILSQLPNPILETQPQYAQSSNPLAYTPNSKDTSQQIPPPSTVNQWPVWDGLQTTFDSYLFQIRVKIEEERNFLGSNRSICLNIFRSIPPIKQPRILHWFEIGGPNGNYQWDLFLNHIKEQFENRQARQTAGNLLQRMRMGENQFFIDYLQDFELKVSQCGGSWSDNNKIMHLDTGLNSRLRLLLLSKSLPDDDYLKWVSKVKAVAGRLENTPNYRPKGCSGKSLGTSLRMDPHHI